MVPLVLFRLGSQRCGVRVQSVAEVLPYRSATPLPDAPSFLDGVLERRGVPIPIVDMRRRFELAAEVGRETRILIVLFRGEPLGLVVDAVDDVREVPSGAITPPAGYTRGIAPEYLEGIIRDEAALILLLDVDRILSAEERIALETHKTHP